MGGGGGQGGGGSSGGGLLGSLGGLLGLGGGNKGGGSGSSMDWLLPLLGGAAAGYFLPKVLGGGSGGSQTVVQAPNYYEQFGRTNIPSYNPGVQPIVGLSPGYQMSNTVLPTGPVAPR
jgi:hypothetical protein